MQWLTDEIAPPNAGYYKKALKRQSTLTKPAGSLGVLEKIAVKLAAMQHTETPKIERVWVSVFAADHGIAEENVSAFPQVVTTEMVKNFINNGAAVNVLSNYVNADFEVIDVGLIKKLEAKGLIVDRAGKGTANFTKQAAMTEQQMHTGLCAGQAAVQRAIKNDTQLFIAGEMGIANTSSASAIAITLTGLSVEQLTGAGTGLASDAIQHKASVIKKSLALHQNYLETPLKVLQYLGGFEIAALVGAYLYAAQHQLPILIDGFISSVAALLASQLNADVQQWFFYAHCSEEKGHRRVLEQLQAQPLLDLGMRLGEASGAVLAVPLLQMACKLHNEMATFVQAEITIQ